MGNGYVVDPDVRDGIQIMNDITTHLHGGIITWLARIEVALEKEGSQGDPTCRVNITTSLLRRHTTEKEKKIYNCLSPAMGYEFPVRL